MTDESLSEKIDDWWLKEMQLSSTSTRKEKLDKIIQEAVKKLKDVLVDGNYYGDKSFTSLFEKIDKIFGEELI